MGRKKSLLILGIILIAFAFVVAGGIFYLQVLKVNYLIPGVPYFGFYNHFLDANSTITTSAADILGYWGDERFSIVDLQKIFTEKGYKTTLDLQAFFQNNGYNTYRWGSYQPGDELKEIKKFVNSQKKTPVIVYQRRSPDPNRLSLGTRVVIGIYDKDQKVIIHDYSFGNNYEISYKDFLAMFQPDSRAILAVWPKDELLSEIKGPNFDLPYPARWETMDEIGNFLMKGADAITFYYEGQFEKALQLYEEFLNESKLDYFPPVHRLLFYRFLSWCYFLTGNHEAAIEVINSKMLPINHDLSQPYGAWTEQIDYFKTHNYTEDRAISPFYQLGLIYAQKGDKQLAQQNFEEAIKINPDNQEAQEALDLLLK